ncbi:MAG TPA: hypothetical protein DCE78_05550 [Bacteroidetes bacterium]|nr:hypothetical protein [Bacteroidota bacterium]
MSKLTNNIRRVVSLILPNSKPLLLLALSVIFFGVVGVTSGQDSSNTINFTILHTNDEHAALVPRPLSDYGLADGQTNGGIARVATLINEIRTQKAVSSEPVLVVSAGDFISGSPFSWLNLQNEAPELTLMIESGYDVITLGNHEFDYGPEMLANYLKIIGYPEMALQVPIVASNTLITEGHILGEMGIQQTHVKRLSNGLIIGFFGLMGKHAADVAPMAKPITFADQVESARKSVADLQNEGVDVIVLLSHSGEGEEAAFAEAVPGIDVIIGGHTHSVLSKPIISNGTIIVQTGTEFQYVGQLEFAFNTETKELEMLNMPGDDPDDTYLIKIDQNIAEDPRIKVLTDQYSEKLNKLVSDMTNGRVSQIDQTIAQSEVTLKRTPIMSETPLGNFIADAMLFGAEEATNSRVDFVFQASGVIRGDMIPSPNPSTNGALSFYDVSSLIGLGSGPDGKPGYPMVSIYFTGEEIRRILEITVLLSEMMGDTYFLQNSRLKIDFDPNRAMYFRIPFKGTPIPTGKAILEARMYTGEGRQTNITDDYVTLNKGDETLYHVVSDYYNASFLPMVGEIVPSLKLVMKDENGNPVDLKDRIIYKNGSEAKVWEAVVSYLMQQPQNESGVPVVDATYENVEGRWNKIDGPSVILFPVIILIGTLGIIIFLIVLIRKRRRARIS